MQFLIPEIQIKTLNFRAEKIWQLQFCHRKKFNFRAKNLNPIMVILTQWFKSPNFRTKILILVEDPLVFEQNDRIWEICRSAMWCSHLKIGYKIKVKKSWKCGKSWEISYFKGQWTLNRNKHHAMDSFFRQNTPRQL